MKPKASYPTFWVSRSPINRKRHARRTCHAVVLGIAMLEDRIADGLYDHFESEGYEAPSVKTRYVKVTPKTRAEYRALLAFTIPCRHCVPGAKELMADLPFTFERRFSHVMRDGWHGLAR